MSSFNYLKEQRGLVQELQSKYRPYQNLYEKHYLQQKSECYQQYQSQPQQYYQCLERLEQTLETNAKYMENKFNGIEIQEKECHEECKLFFKEALQQQVDQCMAKCIQNQKQSAFGTYDSFYKEHIGTNIEYKKLRK